MELGHFDEAVRRFESLPDAMVQEVNDCVDRLPTYALVDTGMHGCILS